MSNQTNGPSPWSMTAAEGVLHRIYGDDLEGCPVRLSEVATIVEDALPPPLLQAEPLLGLYEQLIEAIHLLSTPPEHGGTLGADELRTLLGQRLDNIHSLTTRTRETIAPLAATRRGEQPDLPYP
jgi:hypothetical protein